MRQPVSAIFTGLGAYSSHQADVFSIVNNQASLAGITQASAGVYGERKFWLSETSMYTAAVAIPTSQGNFGANINYAGFNNFNESQVGLAYARSMGRMVDIGVQFNFYGYRVPAYIHQNTVNFEIGALVHLTDQLNIGLHAYNPVGGKFSKTDEKLTAVYKLGIGYDASEKFFAGAEIVKEQGAPVSVNAALQYQFMKQFFARAGISTASSESYGGAGVSWNNFRLIVSGSYHPQLGWSPGLSLIYGIGGPVSSTVETPE